MEQLSYFVTKSFEYSNTTNRVLEIIKMSAKFEDKLLDKNDDKTTSINGDSMDDDDDEVSVEIDITDDSDDVKINNNNLSEEKIENCDKKFSDKRTATPPPPSSSSSSTSSSSTTVLTSKTTSTTKGLIERTSPLPLIKKLNRDGTKHVTKNWLISDCPKKKVTDTCSEIKSFISSPENQENAAINLIRVEDLVGRKQVRAKPVNELLKQFREINNQSPLSKINENFKVELVDEENKIKSGENSFPPGED